MNSKSKTFQIVLQVSYKESDKDGHFESMCDRFKDNLNHDVQNAFIFSAKDLGAMKNWNIKIVESEKEHE